METKINGEISNFKFQISILLFTIIVACGNPAKESHQHSKAQTYTCPMHPKVILDKPGTCPICGMDLVKASKSDAGSNDLMLSDSQIKLANITTQKVSRRTVGQTASVNGRLSVDEEKSEVISSRAAGRVERLFIKETGQTIKKGEPLYSLYSETLLTLQQEYLLAKEQYEELGKTEKRYGSFLNAAEKKLLLYGLTKKQIDQLKNQASIQPRITFLSTASGIIKEINVTEGQYVAEGGLIYKIDDINNLWVEAELYPNETAFVKKGDMISLRVNADESTAVEAKVNFLSPEFKAGTQLTIMRASIANPGFKYKPGQQAQVYFSHSNRDAVAIPADAVIRDGKGAHVYVRVGHNTFRPRMVKTGVESFDQVEITEGINEGDTVAVSGAYLLYSEIVLKKGTDPMAGHNH